MKAACIKKPGGYAGAAGIPYISLIIRNTVTSVLYVMRIYIPLKQKWQILRTQQQRQKNI